MTPDELAAIEARDATSSVASYWQDRHVLLAALRTEQEARARVEAAARVVVEAFPEQWSPWRTSEARWAALDALRAAAAPDASEGGETE